MATWLVTGAGGFLGSNAGRFLHDRVETVGQFRNSRTDVAVFRHVESCELGDVNEIRQLVASSKPDVILHCAAVSRHSECDENPELAKTINIDSTRILAAEAERIGANFIYISTDAVFSGDRGGYTESDPTNPFSIYGETKLLGEYAALRETNALVIRTNFFGWSPSGTASILEFFVNALEEKRRIKGFTDFTVTTTYVSKLMNAIWVLEKTGADGIFHIASRDPLSKYEFGVNIANIFGLDAGLIQPVSELIEPRDSVRMRDISLVCNKFEELTKFQLSTQRQGIEEAYKQSKQIRTRHREFSTNSKNFDDMNPEGATLDSQNDLGGHCD